MDKEEKYVKAKARYELGESLTSIGIDLSLDRHWLSNRLRKDGIIAENRHNSLKFDNTVFDSIDNPSKAYWLGFLYADGYVSDGKTTNNVELSLKLSDYDHLNKYRKFLRASNEVKTDSFRCRMTVTNKYLRDRLEELGCTPRKSLTLTFPDISIFKEPSLVRSFIRGYVDGDGSLCLVRGKSPQLAILGTREFLDKLQTYLPINKLHKLSRNNYSSDSNTFVLSFNGGTAIKVSEFLYNKSKTYLSRKYIKHKEFCRLK